MPITTGGNHSRRDHHWRRLALISITIFRSELKLEIIKEGHGLNRGTGDPAHYNYGEGCDPASGERRLSRRHIIRVRVEMVPCFNLVGGSVVCQHSFDDTVSRRGQRESGFLGIATLLELWRRSQG